MSRVERFRQQLHSKKLLRLAAAPVGMGLAIAGTACTETIPTNFPPCSSDPQTKTKSIGLSDSDWEADVAAVVDGVRFSLVNSTPPRVDISSSRKNPRKVRVLDENHIEFDGLKDGRVYDVQIKDITSRRARIDVEASCKGE